MKKYVRSSSELDPRFNFSFDEIGPEFWLKTTTEPARIYLEDENVEGNGACMRYSIIVVIPGDQDHWQMKEDITDSFERHLEDVTDGSDYTYNIISVKKCYDWPYAIPDEIPIDSTLYRVVFDIVPYQNIGPDGDYGIDFGIEDDIESSKKINCDEEVVEEISEEVVNDPNAVRTYRNRRNENKFIETKKYKDGHSVARQYMKWETPEGTVKNYSGAKDAKRGRWHRAGKQSQELMLEDYDEVQFMKKYIKTNSDYYGDSMMPDTPNIVGVTLLTVEEAKSLSIHQRHAKSNWWLRSPGDKNSLVLGVFGYTGVINDGGFNTFGYLGVRPALKISNLNSSNLGFGDSFEFAGYTWTVISNDKALCNTIIDYSAFREDWRAKYANDYETSDVKKYLDKWFAENVN